MHTKRRNINSQIIRAKGIKLMNEANFLLPEEKKINFKFSDGWLGKFKKRWNLRIIKSHGESGDADMVAVAQELPDIQNVIEKYDRKDISNANECGLFYKLAPDTTVATKGLPGWKKMKDRITLLICANDEGSEKMELMIIGNALRPRPFKKVWLRTWVRLSLKQKSVDDYKPIF